MPVEIVCGYCDYKLLEVDLVDMKNRKYPLSDFNAIIKGFKGRKCPNCGHVFKGINPLALARRFNHRRTIQATL